MTSADKPKFVAALTELALLKPGAKLTAEAYAAWWNALHDWDLADFLRACAQLVRSMEFMPNPYHFEQIRRAALATPGEAWTRAVEHARTLPVCGGFIQEWPTGDASLDAAVRAIGGYKAIANSEALHFLERRFCEHFEQMRDAWTTREAVPLLAGPTRGPKLLGEIMGSKS